MYDYPHRRDCNGGGGGGGGGGEKERRGGIMGENE